MTNTTKSPTTRQRFAARGPEAFVGSPFSRPEFVAQAMDEARRDILFTEVSASLITTMQELVREGLVEEYLSTRGGRGGYARRVRLSEEGRALRARAHRAQLLVLSGLL